MTMNFYDLDSEFDFGKYEGQTLEEIFLKDPKFIEQCLIKVENFNLSDDVLDELKAIDDEFEFSDEALKKREEKFIKYEEENDDEEEFFDKDLEEFMDFNGQEETAVADDEFDEFDDLSSDIDDDFIGGGYDDYDDDDY